MRLAVVLIHYHTPDLAAAAVDALRRDLAGSGLSGLETDWLLVDNGSDAAERAMLESLPLRRIDPGRNLGYAGGVNRGVAETEAELILVMNPDVLVLPGCVPALVERLAASGPLAVAAGTRSSACSPAAAGTGPRGPAAAGAGTPAATGRPARPWSAPP
jgi:N-acetylglucosaminyl-diphospho-decaprenol L-rhamnosyltransferase